MNDQTPAHIVLVDDDQNIVTSLKMALENEGWQVSAFHDGEDGLAGILTLNPDLVVLDIKMPRMNGIEMLQKLRMTSAVPVIFLTSKDDEVDEIVGLQMGADDYISKPFSQRLLIARIQTLLKRSALTKQDKVHGDPQSENTEKLLHCGALTLDMNRFLCLWNKQPLDFTVTEFLLLATLAKRPGHVKNRDQLIESAYGSQIYVDERTIDSHIKRIRKKFKKIDDTFDEIETLYGIGYRYKES